MCSAGTDMPVEAQHLLADLLADMCKALDPEHPELVRVGPVDFGPVLLRRPDRGVVATATVYQSDDRGGPDGEA